MNDEKQPRIQIIREAISEVGGNNPNKCGYDYYCDSPDSQCGIRNGNITVYKIPKESSGMTLADRQQVVDSLNEHPDVLEAYLTRKYCSCTGGHIKVLFLN